MTIHKEGKKLLLILTIVLIIINILSNNFYPQFVLFNKILLITSVVLFLLILQFFRNPRVAIHIDDKKVLAPADGKVVVIEEVVEEEYFNTKRKQISIFMSPVNLSLIHI